MFADDVNIFKRISSVEDCRELQTDLNALSDWCSLWRMKLNLTKCFYVNFSLKRVFDFSYDYSLNDHILERVYNVKDLGVYFSHNLRFTLHISTIVNKAFRMLGFVKRTMKNINCISVHKILYNAYIRSCLDYCSVVWSPNAQYLINKVERVQKRFLKHLCFIGKVDYHTKTYTELCEHFRFTTLDHRRKVNDSVVFHQILHGRINCPYLLSCICLDVPVRRTRHTKAFTTKKKSRLSLRKHDFMPKTLTSVNSMNSVDFFDRSLTKAVLSLNLS